MTTTQTQTLADFLLARLAADEAVARAAIPGPWEVHPDGEVHAPHLATQHSGKAPNGKAYSYTSHFFVTSDSEGILPAVQPLEAAHIARHDPARVLAEVEAKRRIVGLHPANPHGSAQGAFCQTCDTAEGGGGHWPCDTLRLLALPYASHVEYRDDWKP